MFRNKWVLTGLSALLLNLSCLVSGLSFLVWIAFIPMFHLISETRSLWKTSLYGVFIGLVYFSGLFYWIIKYQLWILMVVLAFAAPFFGLFAYLTATLQKRFSSLETVISIFIPGLAWSLISMFYSLSPVRDIADVISFYEAARFPGLVRVIGVSGITFLILTFNSLVFHFLRAKKLAFGAGLLIFICLLVLGSFVIARSPEGTTKQSKSSEIASPDRPSLALMRGALFGKDLTSFSESAGTGEPSGRPPLEQPAASFGTLPRNDGGISVALIQHNFPIDPAWRNKNKERIMNYYEQTVRSLGASTDLIIFPQYGLPVDVLRQPNLFQNLSRETKSSILLATYLPRMAGGSPDSGDRSDSALLFAPQNPVQEYQAVIPPPFRRIGQVLGMDKRLLLFKRIPLGVMLCYEDIRSDETKIWTRKGAQVLISLSNPGHFLKTHLPSFHFAQDRLRAIETGRYVVRVSPNGFSGIIDPNGKVLLKSQLGTAEILKGSVYPTKERTVFSRLPISIHAILAGLFLIVAVTAYARDSMKRLALKMR